MGDHYFVSRGKRLAWIIENVLLQISNEDIQSKLRSVFPSQLLRCVTQLHLTEAGLRSDKEARIAFAISFHDFLCSTNDVLADGIAVEVRLLHAEDQRAHNRRAIQPNQFCFG